MDQKLIFKYLVLTGIFDAINGVLVVYPTLPNHLVPVLSTAWPAISQPLMVLVRRIWTQIKVTKGELIALCIATVGCMCCFLPITIDGLLNSDSGEFLDTIFWSLIFILGLLVACFMTMATEYLLKGGEIEIHDIRQVNAINAKIGAGIGARIGTRIGTVDPAEYAEYGAWVQWYMIVKFEMYRSWIQLAVMLILNFVDIIPWFGTSKDPAEVWSHVYDGMKCLVQTSDSPESCSDVWRYTFKFSLSYVVAYLTNDILTKHYDANVSTFVQGLSVPIAILFFVFTPEGQILTPAIVLPWAFVGAVLIFIGSMILAVHQRARKHEPKLQPIDERSFLLNQNTADTL